MQLTPNVSGGERAKEGCATASGNDGSVCFWLRREDGAGHNVVDLETNFLQKPYRLKQPADTIRCALNLSLRLPKADFPAGNSEPRVHV
jgi:hypothetical protein